jgi:hypothetical protein
MKWSCGLLDGDDDKLRYLRHHDWNDLDGPLADELEIWLAMPGFSMAFHEHTLGKMRRTKGWRLRYGLHDKWKDEVAENWSSATREDAIALARMRPRGGSVPLLTQVSMLRNLERGWRQSDVARTYRVSPAMVANLKRGQLTNISDIPASFSLHALALPRL